MASSFWLVLASFVVALVLAFRAFGSLTFSQSTAKGGFVVLLVLLVAALLLHLPFRR